MFDVTVSSLPARKTKPKGRHPHKALSAAFVRSAPPGKHCDGNGLYLYVKPNGARSWIQRLVIRGRRRDFGLGGVALVSLAEAREKARANRKLAREGGDPLTERRRTRNMPTFAEAAERGGGAEAVRLAQSKAGPRLDGELSTLRLSSHRPDAGLGGDQRRCPGDPRAHLAREGAHGPDRATAHAHGPGVGRGNGIPDRQPLRPGRVRPRSTGRRGAAHAGPAASRSGGGDPEGMDFELGARVHAGLRVPGAHGSEVGRGALCRLVGDRSGAKDVGRFTECA